MSGVVRLQRDSVTLTGYLVLATWAWFLYGFGALLPELGREQGTSATVTSIHSVLLATGALIAGGSLVPLIRRFRRRGVITLASSLVLLGSVVFTVGGAYTAVTLTAILLTGTGGSLLVSSANPMLDDHHGPHGLGHGAAALSEGNALGSACGLLAPLAVGLGVAVGLTWRPAILLTVPLAIATILLARRQPAGVLALDAELPPASGERAVLPSAFWPVFGMLVCLVGVEFVMAAWSAELLRVRAGLSAGAAAAGVSTVVGGMAVGRVLTGRFALRRPARPLLGLAVAVSLAGFVVAWLGTSPAVVLTGLAITGLGMGAHYPLGASLALAAVPGQADRAAGLLSIGVGIAAGGGPFALGALSDASGTHTAFLVVPVLLVTGLALLLLSRPQDVV